MSDDLLEQKDDSQENELKVNQPDSTDETSVDDELPDISGNNELFNDDPQSNFDLIEDRTEDELYAMDNTNTESSSIDATNGQLKTVNNQLDTINDAIDNEIIENVDQGLENNPYEIPLVDNSSNNVIDQE